MKIRRVEELKGRSLGLIGRGLVLDGGLEINGRSLGISGSGFGDWWEEFGVGFTWWQNFST